MRKRRKYQEGGESRYVQPKNILNPKAPKQYPIYKQPRDPNAFYRNASPGNIDEDYTIESFLLPSPALKGAGQLYKGTKAGLKRLAKEGLEDEAKLASEYAAKVQSRANIAAKRDSRLLNKQRVLGQADFEDLTNDARHFYSEHGIELPPAEFDAIKHLNPHVNKAAARQALKAADAGDDVFGGLHGKATLRDARRAGLSDDEINQMRAGRLKPYTNPAKPIVGFYGSNRHGGRVSYRTGSRLIPNPGFDTGVQVSDATRTRIPKNAQAALASEEYNRDLTGRSGLSEEGFRAKYNKSRARARNMPSSFDVISNQLWEGAKEPFKFIGADPDLIRTNPTVGIPQALTGVLAAELPVGEIYQASKQGISRLKKALGTESGLLSNTYKVNPWAFKPNPEAYYRGIGKKGMEDIFQSGVIKSKKQHAYPEPYFSKGVIGDKYAKGYFAELTGEPMKGVGSFPEGSLIQTPVNTVNINNPNLKLYQKDWLRGYKEVSKPSFTPKFKSEIDWAKWNSETPNYPELINEYNAIEESTKKAGTWMKNPDGSPFQGTPEQFVQQNSQNFKKAFPNGALTTFRGGSSNNVMRGNLASDNPNIGSIFTGNKTSIHRYGDRNRIITPEENSIDNGEPGMMELLYNKKNNVLEFDAKNSNWDNIKKELLPDNHKTIKAITQTSRENPLITTTDDIARHLQDKDIDYATINNIIDGTPFSRETIFNHKPGNYLKSRWYNNGMFDMTNPNIYKSLVPTAIGTTALGITQQKREGGETEPYYISDSVEFKRANKAYQDSSELYNFYSKLNERIEKSGLYLPTKEYYTAFPPPTKSGYEKVSAPEYVNNPNTYSSWNDPLTFPHYMDFPYKKRIAPLKIVEYTSKTSPTKSNAEYEKAKTNRLNSSQPFPVHLSYGSQIYKKPVRKPIYKPNEISNPDTVFVPSTEPKVSATSPNDTILELGRSTVGKDGKRLYRKGTQDISEQEFNQLLQTYPKSRVKEYGFGGKLFKSIGDGLQNSGAFLADNALSMVGATEAANNLYTDSRFGKAAQNVSKITNQINKVAGTIGATALGGPAAGMAMGQVQNMTGNINRKPNQEYNDWDVAGQYAGSLSSMAGMFYNPAGATSSVNPKAKYGGSIRRKIAKQGGTIRPTKGGMFINEGFGVEHALGNLHEDGGIVYNDRTEVENNEKILDGNYVLTDQPYSEPYMKESISRRFDKNSKAISDRNNPEITESAMSFLKDEAIAKNEEYLESLESMTNRYAKGGWIQKATDSIERRGTEGKCTPITKPGCTGRARALALTFKKMAKNRHQDGGSIRNLGTQEGRVVTNRFFNGGLTETDLLNQEEARKMAELKQSILNQNSLPTSQKQYFIDPANYAYDPTWMGDIYNTARNHDIAVQRTNDISNDPNYAGYGQGSKGIPYRYPSPKPQTQKQFPWEDTLYGVASLAPAIYNMGAGLFGKTQQYNPENYITRGRLNYKPISGEETKRQINSQRAATDYQLRDAGITSRRSRLNNSYNAMQTMAQAQERIDNINTQGQLETDRFNLGLDQGNNRIRLTVADINDRNKAARQQMLAQGLSDVSEFAQGTKRDKIMKSMLTKMYGRRGGRIAW